MFYMWHDVLYVALSAGLPVFSEKCIKCSTDHLDQGVFAMNSHKKAYVHVRSTWVG